MACSLNKSHITLTYGALNKILNGHLIQNVVLQILGYKEIPGSQNTRFRLLLNDGETLFSYAILATSLNHFIHNRNLEKYTVFMLKSYVCNQLEVGKKVIVCVDIEILTVGSEVNAKIKKNIPCNVENRSAVSVSNSVQNNDQLLTVSSNPSTSDVVQNWDTARIPGNSHTDSTICSISAISPYNNKWLIKAYLYYKTPLNFFNNSKKQGCFFSFYLLDDSGEIKATAFNDIAERIFNSVELFKTYLISTATVKRARETISFKGDFELVIEENTKIVPYGDFVTPLPTSFFKFHTIEEIMTLPKESYTDVIGMCMYVSDTNLIITKLNKEATKRNFVLFDQSKKSISVTLWNSQAINFKADKNEVVAIKNAKITSYDSCSLCVDSSSMVYVNPAIRESDSIRSWFCSLTPAVSSQVSSYDPLNHKASQVWKTLSDITKNENNTEWPVYYKTKATVVMVNKQKCLYQACPTINCSKKVNSPRSGIYNCTKCNKDFNTFCWTIFLQLELADYRGNLWAVAFQETAEKLIGMSSEELTKIRDENQEKFNDILNGLNLKTFIFELRSHLEVFGDDVHLRTTILNFYPINIPFYTKKLYSDIEKSGKILNR